MLNDQKVEKTMEMARNKGAKYFDVTSVSHLTKNILDQFSFKGWYFFTRLHLIQVFFLSKHYKSTTK